MQKIREVSLSIRQEFWKSPGIKILQLSTKKIVGSTNGDQCTITSVNSTTSEMPRSTYEVSNHYLLIWNTSCANGLLTEDESVCKADIQAFALAVEPELDI